MPKGEVRRRMVATAARLLAENGPPGASFGDVLKASGASRGSVYHHFPGGRREMYAAAIDLASRRAFEAMEDTRGRPAEIVVTRFFEMWRTLLTGTDLRIGCAVLAVAVAGEDRESVDHAGQVFSAWRAHLASLFVDSGLPHERAAAVAATTIAAAEGAVAMARAEGDILVFDEVAALVTTLVRAG